APRRVSAARRAAAWAVCTPSRARARTNPFASTKAGPITTSGSSRLRRSLRLQALRLRAPCLESVDVPVDRADRARRSRRSALVAESAADADWAAPASQIRARFRSRPRPRDQDPPLAAPEGKTPRGARWPNG